MLIKVYVTVVYLFYEKFTYVYQWRSKGERGSAPGSKINPLESMIIISNIMLKSKNKAANSGCNSTYQDF